MTCGKINKHRFKEILENIVYHETDTATVEVDETK